MRFEILHGGGHYVGKLDAGHIVELSQKVFFGRGPRAMNPNGPTAKRLQYWLNRGGGLVA